MVQLLKSLWPLLRRYQRLFWLGTLFIVISNWFAIYPAQIVREAFDLVADLLRFRGMVLGLPAVAQVDSLLASSVALFAALVVAAALLRGLFLFLVRQTIIVASRMIEYEQKNQLFERFQGYSLSILRRQQTGDLMARISEDVGHVRMFVGPGIMYALNTITIFVMVLITMLLVNTELTIYALAPMPVLSLLIYLVHSRIMQRSTAKQAQLSKLSSFAQESFNGIRLLRAYSRDENTRQRFAHTAEAYQQSALRLISLNAVFFPLVNLLVGLSSVLTLWIGGERVMSGQLSVGTIAEYTLYINLLVWPVIALGWVTSLVQQAAASQQRIDEAMGFSSELSFPNQSPAPAQASLSFEHVSLKYADTGIQALKDLSFSLQPGQMLGVAGPTGAGKTTLVQLLLRMFDPEMGLITLGDKPLDSYSMASLRGSIACVPQDPFLFSDTIRANICFGQQNASPEQVEQAAAFAGILEEIKRFPDGFETLVGERGITLSGGQKQRVAIARAYLTQAPVLILDDALSAVDTETEARILGNLRASRAGSYRPTLIVVAHRLTALQHADNILVLVEGKLAQQGTHSQLLAQQGLYAQLARRQELMSMEALS